MFMLLGACNDFHLQTEVEFDIHKLPINPLGQLCGYNCFYANMNSKKYTKAID